MVIPTNIPIPTLTKNEVAILSHIVTTQSPCYIGNISKELGLAESTVRSSLRSLCTKNLIVRDKIEKTNVGAARQLYILRDLQFARQVLGARGGVPQPTPVAQIEKKGLRVIYAREDFDPSTIGRSIFLAGPTPRSKRVPSWRKKALNFLSQMVATPLTVFVPEDHDGTFHKAFFDDQVEWEEKALTAATVIAFWIPRDLRTLPGFTTNDEFGAWKRSGKVVLGVPPETPKTRYQLYYARKLGIPTAKSLEKTLALACIKVKEINCDTPAS